MLRNSRKEVTVGICIILVISIMAGCKKNDKDSDVVNLVNEESSQIVEVIETSKSETTDADAPEGDGGGNAYNNESDKKVAEIHVLVSEKEYIYYNAPIELDELMSEIQEIKGDKMVYVSDNKATHKAYDKLIDELVALEIPYVEE